MAPTSYSRNPIGGRYEKQLALEQQVTSGQVARTARPVV